VSTKAEKRLTGLVNLPHGRSLRVAEQFAVSAYDARFLGAAQTFKARLVTEDARLRQSGTAPNDFAIRHTCGFTTALKSSSEGFHPLWWRPAKCVRR
jgi:hypothetical protein